MTIKNKSPVGEAGKGFIWTTNFMKSVFIL
jgi:hypothetical protein